jgi:uncharacterized membrane protein YedE/YeeE
MNGSDEKKLQWGERKPKGFFGVIYDTWLDTYVWLSLYIGGLILGFGIWALVQGAEYAHWPAGVGGSLFLLGIVLFVVRSKKKYLHDK